LNLIQEEKMLRRLFPISTIMLLIAGAADYALAEDNCGKFKTVEKSCTSGSCSNTVTLGACTLGHSPCRDWASWESCCGNNYGSSSTEYAQCGLVTRRIPEKSLDRSIRPLLVHLPTCGGLFVAIQVELSGE
jgi:hypothetical protein